jgi:hypothetical protein
VALVVKEEVVNRRVGIGTIALAAGLATMVARAQGVQADLNKEVVGNTPVVFEPMMGTWVVAQDGADKVIKVDGAAYKAAQTGAGRALLENARKFYGTSNEELMDNAKQFAVFPIAVLKTVDSFSDGKVSMKFKTIAGDADRASGILFNVKPNGDWLTIRYNDTEHNIVLWEFHNGIRRSVRRGREGEWMLDRAAWHEMVLTINGAQLRTEVDGKLALEYTLGTEPGPGRNGAPPNPDLIPANNSVLRPPVAGKVGLWSKSDSVSYFKDFVVTPAK